MLMFRKSVHQLTKISPAGMETQLVNTISSVFHVVNCSNDHKQLDGDVWLDGTMHTDTDVVIPGRNSLKERASDSQFNQQMLSCLPFFLTSVDDNKRVSSLVKRNTKCS